MKHFIKRKILFLFLLPVSSVAKGAPWPFPVTEMKQAVFRLELPQKTMRYPYKTGFVIKFSGKMYFVTTFQAIKEWALEEEVHRISNEKMENLKVADLVSFSFLHNLALIEVNNYKGPVLKLADLNGIDSSVYILGFPSGVLAQMQAEDVRSVGNGTLLAVRDIPVRFSGSSGSPVFNTKGKVIGMVSTGHNYQVQFVSSHHISHLLKAGRVPHGDTLKEQVAEEVFLVFDKANDGDPEAQYVLADDFHRTYQKTRRWEFSKEALKWYREAAEQGHFMAQMRLGLMYRTGEGVLQDLEESEKWFQMAVRQNKSPLAQFSLARTLMSVKDSPEVFQTGFKLLKDLADKGFKPAQEDIKNIQPVISAQEKLAHFTQENGQCKTSFQ